MADEDLFNAKLEMKNSKGLKGIIFNFALLILHLSHVSTSL